MKKLIERLGIYSDLMGNSYFIKLNTDHTVSLVNETLNEIEEEFDDTQALSTFLLSEIKELRFEEI